MRLRLTNRHLRGSIQILRILHDEGDKFCFVLLGEKRRAVESGLRRCRQEMAKSSQDALVKSAGGVGSSP